MTTEERRRRRFSEEFRKEQVKLIESQELTIAEVSRLYEVKSANVREWVKKYSSMKLPEQIIVQSKSEIQLVKNQQKEIKKLKQVIADMHLKALVTDEYLKLAKEILGDDFEKKILKRS